MSETAMTRLDEDPMALFKDEYRKQPSIELAAKIVELQVSIDNRQIAMERFEWEREERQSQIDFGSALNACQSAIGRIAPDQERKLKSGATMNWFASYPHLDAAIRPIYLEQGFAISYSEIENPPAGKVGVKAILTRGRTTHEYLQFISIPEGNQATTSSDLEASASSRCMRYLLIKIFNISVGIDKDEMGVYLDGPFIAWKESLEVCTDRKSLVDEYRRVKSEVDQSSRKDKVQVRMVLWDLLEKLGKKFSEVKA